jgi:hypothetical protein
VPLIFGPLLLLGLIATILLARKFDTMRLLGRDFPGDEEFEGQIYRCRIYAGGEASTLTDVGADARGIFLGPPKGVTRSYRHLYVFSRAVFIPWDNLVYRSSRLPFHKQIVFKTPSNGAMFLVPREIALRLFADASREFQQTLQ